MSSSIDQRVVQMRFDNQQFEDGVKTSLNTLDKLNEALAFKDSNNLQGMANALKDLQQRFSTMGIIGMGVLQEIGSYIGGTLIGMFQRLQGTISSLTFAPMAQSFAKYEQMVVNQQTILSAVSGKINKVTGELYNMDDVAAIIDKLRWYTDETSYNLDQMVSAVGNFTASGIDLKDAETMIMGIANACADAGIGAEKADIAMTGFSKAIGAGQLTLSVWNNQLKTSGITNSEKFRKALIDAALAQGTLIKVGDKVMTANRKQEVTIYNLTESLTKYAWANDKVLRQVLNNYSNTVDGIYQLQNEGKIDITASAFDSLREAMEKQGKTMADLGLNEEYDQASQAIRALTNAYKELGLEVPASLLAFRRAQEAVSWSQVVEATATAVRSQWAKTFELIFGNYEEAKSLWTEVSESMWGIFAGGGDDRNAIFELFHDEAYEDFADGIINAFRALDTAAGVLRMSFKRLFVDDLDDYVNRIGSKLINFTTIFKERVDAFHEWIEGINLLVNNLEILDNLYDIFVKFGNVTDLNNIGDIDYDLDVSQLFKISRLIKRFDGLENLINQMENIKRILLDLRGIFRGFTGVLSMFGQAIKAVWNATKPLREVLGNLVLSLLDAAGAAGNFIGDLADSNKVYDTVYKVVKALVDLLMNVGVPAFEWLANTFKKVKEQLSPLAKVFTDTKNAINEFFKSFTEKHSQRIETMTKFFEGLGNVVKITADIIGHAAVAVARALKEMLGGISLEEIGRLINLGLKGGILNAILNKLQGDKKPKMGFLEQLTNPLNKLSEALNGFVDGMKAKSTELIKTGIAIAILAGALRTLAGVNPDQLASAVAGLGVALAELFFFIKGMNGVDIGKDFGKTMKSLITLGIALTLIAGAVKKLGSIDKDSMVLALMALGAIFTELAVFGPMLQNINSKGFITLAASLIVFAGAMKIFAGMEVNELIKAEGAILGLLVILGAFTSFIGNFGGNSVKMIAAAIAIDLISAAMLVFAGVLKILGTMSLDQLGNSLMAITLSLAAFAIAAYAMRKSLAGAAALLVMAGALTVLAPALLLIGKAKPATLVKGLIALAAALGIMAAAAWLLKGAELTIIAFAAAITLLGIGITSVAAGVTALAVGLSAGALAIVQSVKLIIAAITDLLPLIFTGLARAIIAFIEMISNSVSSIVDAIVNIGSSLLDALNALIPKFIEVGMNILVSLLQGIADNIYKITILVSNIIIGFINALSEKLPVIVDAGINLAISFINGLSDGIINNSDALMEAVARLWNSIVYFLVTALQTLLSGIPVVGSKINSALENVKEGIKAGPMSETEAKTIGEGYADGLAGGVTKGIVDNKKTVTDEVGKMADELVKEFNNRKDDFKKSGEAIPSGVASGVDANSGTAKRSVGSFASGLLSIFNSKLGIRSPSRVFAESGKYIDEGIAVGINNGSNIVYDSIDMLADNVITAFSNPMSQIADIVSGEIDIDPTITPILDLSEIQNGVKNMNHMFGGQSIKSGIPSDIYGSGQTKVLAPTLNITFNSDTPITKDTADAITDDLMKSINNELGKLVVNF